MDAAVEAEGAPNPNNGVEGQKPKLVVIMGPTGSGKSRLAIDLAAHFPIEIINADSMQVYKGLDVLTNKVPLSERKGTPHHLLGAINPTDEFTSKDFRDSANMLIDEILSRDHLPIIVGGTNFYIQALVSPFLLDDALVDMDVTCPSEHSVAFEPVPESELDVGKWDGYHSYEQLSVLDPVAANRIHPNDKRKVQRYLDLIVRDGVLPSKLFQGKMVENWGRLDNSRYNCCFICVDASLSVLDDYVGQRVDKMIGAGLLDEVFGIYTRSADYTRGLRQAIGVREFEDLLSALLLEVGRDVKISYVSDLVNTPISLAENMRGVMNSSLGCLLEEAINKFKANTRRLVRRQKRRISRLKALFGWNIHFVDSTESLLGNSDSTWFSKVVEPSAKLIRSFLEGDEISVLDPGGRDLPPIPQRDLWTQYVCEACGHRVLRGTHEWEQHRQGRSHRKRVSQLRRRQGSHSTNSYGFQSSEESVD
ncbi:hypothetical protein Dimus_009418 [Dionaea muscipula]